MKENKLLELAQTEIVRKTGDQLRVIEADLCVVGAGIAGVSSAIEGARRGMKVVLLDSLPTIGGQAINSLIGTFCGLYSAGNEPYQLTYGVADDLIEALKSEENGCRDFAADSGQVILVYNERILGRWMEKTLLVEGVEILLGAVMDRVDVQNGRRITNVHAVTRYGAVDIHATNYIDATGDANLAWLAGAECRVAKNEVIYGSHMATIEGVCEKYLPSPETIIQRLGECGEKYDLCRKAGLVFCLGEGIAFLNMTHNLTPLEPVEASWEAVNGKTQVDNTVRFLKNEFPEAFGTCHIRTYGLPGIRQTRWIRGVSELTLRDVRNMTKFADAVGRTAWPVEMHNSLDGYIWEAYDPDHVHYIPFGCMKSPQLDNYLAAGRCVDGEVAALASVRVMGPCIATGTAAACAFALSCGGSVHDLDIKKLQAVLKDNLELRRRVYPRF